MQQVYVVSAKSNPCVVKIGVAVNVKHRLSALQTGNPELLTVLALFPGGFALERRVHRHFSHMHIRGEWFDFGVLSPVGLITAFIDWASANPEKPGRSYTALAEARTEELKHILSASAGGVSLADLSRATGIHTATVSRYLFKMASNGEVRQGQYKFWQLVAT